MSLFNVTKYLKFFSRKAFEKLFIFYSLLKLRPIKFKHKIWDINQRNYHIINYTTYHHLIAIIIFLK